MKDTKIFCIVLLLVCATVQGWSQASIERSVIGSTGGSFSSGPLLMDYTMGESVITTLSMTTNTLTQGFHQPGSLSISVTEHPANNLEVSVYPNPSADLLNITISNVQEEKISLGLYNIIGQLLEVHEFSTVRGEAFMYTFEMKQYATGTYFLRLSNGKNMSEVIKISKISQ